MIYLKKLSHLVEKSYKKKSYTLNFFPAARAIYVRNPIGYTPRVYVRNPAGYTPRVYPKGIPQGYTPRVYPKGIPPDTLEPIWPLRSRGRGGQTRQIHTYPKISPLKYIHTYPSPPPTKLSLNSDKNS